ncbi:hypothetical protein N7488_007460 [Penicillium malachiteum]|nr:hypothetical protein N7488_007460 [Penicillium malachiteum]
MYQSLRIQLHRAYLSSCATTFPDLVYRLPVGQVPESRAKLIKSDFVGYLIPGNKSHLLSQISAKPSNSQCVILYAHGGGYARGEAKMYLDYMERWVRCARSKDLDIVFLSVEYPLTDQASHPAQRDAFLKSYQYLPREKIPPSNIIFMGDSAGGGCCILSAIESKLLGLPQPAGSILISPWINMSTHPRDGGNALMETDYVVGANTTTPHSAMKWLNGISPTDPDVIPIHRKPEELKGLKPQLILVGGGEFALQEARDWASLCRKADIQHEIVCEWGQLHIYALGSAWIAPSVREKTDRSIVTWIKKSIN